MVSLIVSVPVKSSFDTSSIIKSIAAPRLVLIVRFTKIILPPTAPNHVASQPFASVPLVISKAPTVSLTLLRVLSSNAGASLNYLFLTRSSNGWKHLLQRVMYLPIWFLRTDTKFLLTGLILTYPPLLIQHQWLRFLVSPLKCRGCVFHVTPRPLVMMIITMTTLLLPTTLTGPNLLTKLLRMRIWTLQNISLLLLR